MCVFFFKQKTAYEMRISDWSSDVCSSDLVYTAMQYGTIDAAVTGFQGVNSQRLYEVSKYVLVPASFMGMTMMGWAVNKQWLENMPENDRKALVRSVDIASHSNRKAILDQIGDLTQSYRKKSEEHTSELQSLMRISYAVFC